MAEPRYRVYTSRVFDAADAVGKARADYSRTAELKSLFHRKANGIRAEGDGGIPSSDIGRRFRRNSKFSRFRPRVITDVPMPGVSEMNTVS